MRWWVVFGIVLAALLLVRVAGAHADLLLAVPAPNSSLDESPQEIRLTFSEPVEPRFSRVDLLDSDGRLVETPPSEVENENEIVLIPGDLSQGLYTVNWRVLSTKDGHVTQGSYALGIGVAVTLSGGADESAAIPWESALVRWFNFWGLALGVGSIGFLVFMPDVQPVNQRLIWMGWGVLGLTSVLMLLLQVSQVADHSIFSLPETSIVEQTLSETRFGTWWQVRLGLWLSLPAILWAAERRRVLYGLAMLVGVGILATQSLLSHASAASEDNLAAVLADGLHLLAMVLWVGGLVCFLAAIPKRLQDPATLGKWVAQFSNYARLLVILLILTGIYAAWLQAGNWDALTTTDFGQALLVKLVLMIPLLGIAGINLLLTAQRLGRGEVIWAGRLRGLVLGELVLLAGILGTVGVMTAAEPARNDWATQADQPTPIQKTGTFGDVQVTLSLPNDLVGGKDFTVRFSDAEGQPVEEIEAAELLFDPQIEGVGESRLVLNKRGEGVYTASGANLSVAGGWVIQVYGDRGNKPALRVDFGVPIKSLDETRRELKPDSQQQNRLLLGLGLLLLFGGAGWLVRQWRVLFQERAGLLAVSWLVGGVVFLASAGYQTDQTVPQIPRFTPSPEVPARLMVLRAADRPALLTPSGTLYQPIGEDGWEVMPFDVPINYAYMDAFDNLWVSSQAGLFVALDGEWQQVSSEAAGIILETHGYLYALGQEHLIRLESGKADAADVWLLDPPRQPLQNLVMLGDHTHGLLSDGTMARSADLGLSWYSLDVPEPIELAITDISGNLLAATQDGIETWNFMTQLWSPLVDLPEGQPIEGMEIYLDRLYAIAGGKLYLQRGDHWQAVAVPESEGAYFTSLVFQYPDKLWLLDAAQTRLWVSPDGDAWRPVTVNLR
jgi:copper transport protein